MPKRIKIQDYVFELSKDYEHYYYNEDVEITHLINHNFSNLNDEVEILEDNIEEIEEIPQYRIDNCTDYNYCYLAEKYNKLAKAVNQIRKDLNK